LFPLFSNRYNPIGVDIGSNSIKLAQTNSRGDRIVEAVRWERPSSGEQKPKGLEVDPSQEIIQSVRTALAGRRFHGRRAVYCLGAEQIKILNVRLSNVESGQIGNALRTEIASRLDYSIHEAEIRRIEVQGVVAEGVREFIVFACSRAAITRIIRIAEAVDLEPVAIDIEPSAILRSTQIFRRRQKDQQERFVYLNIGFKQTLLAIFEGSNPLFIKYLPFGGFRFTQALANWLGISFDEAHDMRKNNDDRKFERRDPEVNQTILTAMRPSLEALLSEIAMCIRYHSVSFRGKELSRLIVGGGEANDDMLGLLNQSFPQKILRSNLTGAMNHSEHERSGQWDVAIGLSLKRVAA